MLRSVPNITFVEGVPGDLESMINPSLRNLVAIDDLMQELSNDPTNYQFVHQRMSSPDSSKRLTN